jgi:hypothetical protein
MSHDYGILILDSSEERMIDFLEECKARMADAQKRVQATQQELQAVQVRYQSAVQELNSLQFMINTEMARKPQGTPVSHSGPVTEAATAQPNETNKTDMIRELLRQHPAGITPTEIWKEVKNQMSHRAYLYSVLSRLKERDEVIVRRKKYILKMVPKSAEEKGQAVVH